MLPDHVATGNRENLTEREKRWIDRCGSMASHVYMHECAANLLRILKAGKQDAAVGADEKALEGLVHRLAEEHDYSVTDVREALRDAAYGGVLAKSPQLVMDRAASLREKLNKAAAGPGHEGLVQLVVVGAVEEASTTGPGGVSPRQKRIDAISEVAADYFVNVVARHPQQWKGRHDGWIGVSGGNTVRSIVQEIAKQGQVFEGLRILPLAGEAEPDAFEISANSVALRLKEACGQENLVSSLMTAPFVGHPIQTDQVETWRQTQMTSGGIKDVIEHSKRVSIAFTGIGGKEPNCALERLATHCNLSGDDATVPDEVVGDICYRPICEDGSAHAWGKLSRRLLGLELSHLQKMAKDPKRRVIAVVCGKTKALSTIAAVRGGLVNTLITDEVTALEMLETLEEILAQLDRRPSSTAKGPGGGRGQAPQREGGDAR